MMNDLPPAPDKILHEKVHLLSRKVVPENKEKGLSPYYHFRIHLLDGADIGHINFRIGETSHIINTAGHIGYEIKPQFRGHSYSYYACLAILPFVKSMYSSIILTSDPDNIASIKIIEKLGSTYLNEVQVPRNDPAYGSGAQAKQRYKLFL
ncbi:MAG: GNAT family N-acetyltransferase [Alphaproteobacteria bacterium]|nr:GNAT family N-acetyltransferase [Alphaproteobacteria bacterium]